MEDKPFMYNMYFMFFTIVLVSFIVIIVVTKLFVGTTATWTLGVLAFSVITTLLSQILIKLKELKE